MTCLVAARAEPALKSVFRNEVRFFEEFKNLMSEIRQCFNLIQAVAARAAKFWCNINDIIDLLLGKDSPCSSVMAGLSPLFSLPRVLLATVGQGPGGIARGRLATVPGVGIELLLEDIKPLLKGRDRCPHCSDDPSVGFMDGLRRCGPVGIRDVYLAGG